MNDYRLNWNPPAEPLGAAIKPEPEFAPDLVLEFNRTNCEMVIDQNDVVHFVTEEDCRQIKGAAQAPRSESVRAGTGRVESHSPTVPTVGTPEAAPPQGWVPKVGDRVRVVGYLPPNSEPFGDGDLGTVVAVRADAVDCHMDRKLIKYGKDSKFVTHWSYLSDGRLCLELDTEPLTTSPSNAGWIEHDGDGRPLAIGLMTKIEVEFRNGTKRPGDGSTWRACWMRSGSFKDPFDIVKWRLIQD